MDLKTQVRAWGGSLEAGPRSFSRDGALARRGGGDGGHFGTRVAYCRRRSEPRHLPSGLTVLSGAEATFKESSFILGFVPPIWPRAGEGRLG